MQRLGIWRLGLLVFLVAYAIVLLTELGYAALLWDETPHLYSGLLLSRGQFQTYVQSEAFYPPLFNVITSLFFKAFGAGVFSARLVSVTFSLLSVWVVFEFGNRLYGPPTGLLSSILLASMPSFLWLSRMAMIETMLMFFFTLALLCFFCWVKSNSNKMLVLTGVALGLGFLVKYQMVVAGVIMLVSLLLAGRQYFATRRKRFFLIILVAALVFLPWVIIVYQQYATDMLGIWFYVMLMGNEGRLAYSTRFFTPIFYLIEMTQPYPHIHPIFLPIYILCLLGLVLWFKRRTESDKFSLLSFSVVYIIFTLITSKDWRYITLIFPILAVSASEFILLLWNKAKTKIKSPKVSFRKKSVVKIAAAVLVLIVGLSVVYSSLQGYTWIKRDHVQVPIGDATQYVVEHTATDDEIVVLCGENFFGVDMVEFYLLTSDPNREQPMQYPEKPVDAYVVSFNVTWLIETSEESNVKYLLLYENGNVKFYESELTANKVLETMLETGRFAVEQTYGTAPRRIYVLAFLSDS